MNRVLLEVAQSIEREGYFLLEGMLDTADLAAWRTAIEGVVWSGEHMGDRSRRHAARNLLTIPAVRKLAASASLCRCVEAVLKKPAMPVRGIVFNKAPGANWKVAWHQDRSIAVTKQLDVPGFGPWSVKQNVPHVEPPTEVLNRMLILRLHLDDCFAENGPLRVIPGSHRHGKLDASAIARWRESGAVRTCVVGQGGVVAMRPLLLHASSPAAQPSSRRVVHLEYASDRLPGGLEWYDWGDAE